MSGLIEKVGHLRFHGILGPSYISRTLLKKLFSTCYEKQERTPRMYRVLSLDITDNDGGDKRTTSTVNVRVECPPRHRRISKYERAHQGRPGSAQPEGSCRLEFGLRGRGSFGFVEPADRCSGWGVHVESSLHVRRGDEPGDPHSVATHAHALH